MSKPKKNVVDYYDLKIKVPKHVNDPIQLALDSFEDHQDFVVLTPKLRKEVLKINSTDFIAFLGYLDVEKITEIDKRRLKLDAEFQMQQYIVKTLNPDLRSHYQWCMAALKSLNWGRHLTGS